jgi:hypothetical protein
MTWLEQGWQTKTWYVGGGDDPLTLARYYRYRFRAPGLAGLKFYRSEQSLPFSDYVEGGDGHNINGDTRGHWLELERAPFEIGDRNVMDWAKECVTTGRAEFFFEIKRNDWINRINTNTLRVRFSDRSLAMMFKLAFR